MTFKKNEKKRELFNYKEEKGKQKTKKNIKLSMKKT